MPLSPKIAAAIAKPTNPQVTTPPPTTVAPTQTVGGQTPAYQQQSQQMYGAPQPKTATTPAPIQPKQNQTPQVVTNATQTSQPAPIKPLTPPKTGTLGNRLLDNQSKKLGLDQQKFDYQTNQENRLTEIQKNLDEAQTTNPQSFASREIFDKSYNYAGRGEEQKAILDASYQKFTNAPTQQIMDGLYAGVAPTPDQKMTPQYAQAMQRKTTIDGYSALQPDVLAGMLESSMKPGSDTYSDMMKYNPALLQQAVQIKQDKDTVAKINKNASRTGQILTASKPNAIRSLSSQVQVYDFQDEPYKAVQQLVQETRAKEINLGEAFTKYVSNDPRLNSQKTKLQESSDTYQKYLTEEKDIQNRILTQRFQGDAPASFIAAMTAQLSKPIQDKIAIAQSQMQIDQNQYKLAHELAVEQFEAYQAQDQKNVTDRRIYENKATGIEQTFNQEQVAKQTAKTTFDNTMTRDATQQGYNVENDMRDFDQGLIMDDRNFEQQKQLGSINQGYNVTNDMRNFEQQQTLANQGFQNDLQLASLKTGNATVDNKSSEKLNTPDGERGGQCGVFANRAAGLQSEPGGDDTNAGRVKTYTDTKPVVGGLVFFDNKSGRGSQKNGHVAIVTAISGDTMTIKQSNARGDEIVSTETMKITEASGFYNKTPLAQGQGQVTLTKEDRSNLAKLADDFRKEPAVKDYKAVAGVREWLNNKADLNSSDQQGLVSNYAKILDPTSVVREGEYAMAGKYSQSKIEQTTAEIQHYFKGTGELSETGQKILKEAMKRRMDAMESAYQAEVEAYKVQKGYRIDGEVPIEAITGIKETQGTGNTAPTGSLEDIRGGL